MFHFNPKYCYIFALFFVSLSSFANQDKGIAKFLDGVHSAAKNADASAYFNAFSDDAIVFGTDLSERWDKAELKAYTSPILENGGFEFVVIERHVMFDDSGEFAWFDEVIENKDMGALRATGVIAKEDGVWKFKQYHLTLPVPNEIVGDVIKMISEM